MSTEVSDGRAGRPAAYEPDPRRWRILGVALVVGFMSLLDVTIVDVAIPTMRAGLGTSSGTIQWVVSGYALAFGLTLVAGGRLGDAYGRRRLMVVGLVGFVASSAAVGLAPDVATVIAARLVQGATAGLLTPQNSGLIQDLFRGEERGRAFGLFGSTVAISSATGPVLGGAVIALAGEDQGWRWLFLVNVPIGLVALVAILRLVPGSPAGSRRPGRLRIDGTGAVLLGLAVLCLLYPTVQAASGASPVLFLLLGAPLLLAAFVRWERRVLRKGGEPLLDLTLLRALPGYSSGLAVGTLYFTGFTGIFLVLSVHAQEALGLSPLATGVLLTPFALGAAVTSPVAGRLVSRLDRRLTVLAIATMMTGIALAAVLVPDRQGSALWWTLVPCLLLAGLGSGAVISPNFTLTLAQVPPRMGGAAGAALQTGQRIGSSIGAALLVTAYQLAGLRGSLLTALSVLGLALLVAAATARRPAPAEPSGGSDA